MVRVNKSRTLTLTLTLTLTFNIGSGQPAAAQNEFHGDCPSFIKVRRGV